MIKPITFALAVALLLTACQVPSITDRARDNKLRTTLNSYESVIRWGTLEKAYGFLSPELSAKASIPAGLGNIRVTSYEHITGPRQLGEDRATQTVLIEYVEQDRQIVHRLTDQQVWQWVEDESTWQRVSPIPAFK